MIQSLSVMLRQRLDDIFTLPDILNAPLGLRMLSARVRRMIPVGAGRVTPTDIRVS